MRTLSELPNVGKVLEHNLKQIGITTPEALRETGVAQVFLRIKEEVDAGACLSMLYGIAGAIKGVRHTNLSKETKEELKAFYKSLE
ncbi:MAG: TfoX/Sxy family DNA transformation protein [Christensenellaceae bacterium]|jgi:DNA transformation protein